MIKVKIEDDAALEFQQHIDCGSITSDDLEIIRAWMCEIQTGNYESRILNSRYWNDHPLDGSWKGYRSSSFGFKGRIIYRREQDRFIILVVRITPDHDYER